MEQPGRGREQPVGVRGQGIERREFLQPDRHRNAYQTQPIHSCKA